MKCFEYTAAIPVVIREQLQRQIRLVEVQLAHKAGSSAVTDVSAAAQKVQAPPWWMEWKGDLKGIGQTDPRTATVNAERRFDALILTGERFRTV